MAKFWVLEEQRKFGSCERSRSFSQGWFGKKNVKNGEWHRNADKVLVARILFFFLFKLFQVLAFWLSEIVNIVLQLRVSPTLFLSLTHILGVDIEMMSKSHKERKLSTYLHLIFNI